MLIRRLIPLLALLSVLMLGACGGDGDTSGTENAATAGGGGTGKPSSNAPAPSGAAVRSAKVRISDFQFTPAKVTIQAGGKVTWLNDGPSDHTATLDDGSFDSGTLQPGKLKSDSFKQAGTFPYHCQIHPQMTAMVVVVGSG